jgi:DNA damage-inducible protein
MAQEVMVRMDDDLSLRLHEVCDEIGLPISVAFLIFAKRVVRDRKIGSFTNVVVHPQHL